MVQPWPTVQRMVLCTSSSAPTVPLQERAPEGRRRTPKLVSRRATLPLPYAVLVFLCTFSSKGGLLSGQQGASAVWPRGAGSGAVLGTEQLDTGLDLCWCCQGAADAHTRHAHRIRAAAPRCCGVQVFPACLMCSLWHNVRPACGPSCGARAPPLAPAALRCAARAVRPRRW